MTYSQFACIRGELINFHQIDQGRTLTTSARHPELGCIVVVQDFDPDELILLCEEPPEERIAGWEAPSIPELPTFDGLNRWLAELAEGEGV